MKAFRMVLAVASASVLAGQSAAQEDATIGAPPFTEGDVIRFEDVKKIRPYLPPEFWANRDLFFYEGMQIEIGPIQRDYSEAPEYTAATQRFRGQPRIGPDGSLENYTAGRPFPIEDIDCANDPQAGVKLMWNFDYRWQGDGLAGHYMWSYWDRGERLPLYYEATGRVVQLSHRVEPEVLEERNGDLFRKEYRKWAQGIDVLGPFDVRGFKVLTYRYKDADKPLAQNADDDQWIYVATLRRVRRFTQARRTDAISGTDFTFDDFQSFFGIIPHYEWECLGEADVLAPVNSKVKAFPYEENHRFGPTGLSFADDRWELRRAVRVRMIPRDRDHPYKYKDFYLDKQTFEPLYSFAWDHKDELWKILWHNSRWSGDAEEKEYRGWDAVPEPRDLYLVADVVANVQTGTGNRIESWSSAGTPMKSRGQVRRFVEVSRLTRGR